MCMYSYPYKYTEYICKIIDMIIILENSKFYDIYLKNCSFYYIKNMFFRQSSLDTIRI